MQFDRDLKSPFRELFLAIRDSICRNSGVQELKKEKITTYSYNGSGLCHLRTMPNGVDIGFLKGAFFKDKYKLLSGDTKRMRVLTLDSLKQKELDYYLEQALQNNR